MDPYDCCQIGSCKDGAIHTHVISSGPICKCGHEVSDHRVPPKGGTGSGECLKTIFWDEVSARHCGVEELAGERRVCFCPVYTLTSPVKVRVCQKHMDRHYDDESEWCISYLQTMKEEGR